MSGKETTPRAARVAVVNDDPVQLRLLSGLVRNAGHEAIVYSGAEDAIERLDRADPPDLIVTDLHMPGIDGWRFCRLLRSPEYAEFNGTPILVVSATFAGEDAGRITAETGANAFLPSPIDGPTFTVRVRALLAGESVAVRAKVLVVDDSESVRRLLRKAFESHGYDVSVAKTGSRGAELFRRHLPEIVVLDYQLPDVLGDELLGEIRRLAPLSVAIMITTDPDPQLAVTWMRKGASAYARKPFDPAYLIERGEHARRERSLLQVEDTLEERTRELRQSEEKHRQLFATVSDAIMLFDAETRQLVDVNGAAVELYGYTKEEFLELTHRDITVEPESSDASIKEAVVRGVLKIPLRHHKKKDGTVFPVEISGSTFVLGDRTLACGVVRDITHRRRAEEDRLRLEAQTQQAQKLESLNVMAGSVAHNFNNLLTVVLGYLELAASELPPRSSATRSIVAADRAAKRAAELSTLMLTYVGQGQVSMRALDITEIVRGMSDTFDSLVLENVTLKLDLSPEPDLLAGDAAQVRQVITSLVTNAVEAIGGDEGIVTLRTRTVSCDRNWFRQPFLDEDLPEGDCVCLEVSDTGCGMDAETLARVFDPFFTTKFTGRGMGMAAVLGIARMHRGAVSLRSEPGGGTTVRAVFPVVERRRAAREEGGEEEGGGDAWRGEGTVLLVDDEPMVRDVAGLTLLRMGFEVLTAANGREAVETYRQHADRVRCVVLDMTMTGLGGVETFGELRGVDPAVRVLVASGYEEDRVAGQFGDARPAGFIQKPFRSADLSAKLREVLGAAGP